MQSNDSTSKEVVCRRWITEKVFEICSGQLNKGLEKVPLLTVVPRRVPESFEDLVTFPPIGKVLEIDPVQIVL